MTYFPRSIFFRCNRLIPIGSCRDLAQAQFGRSLVPAQVAWQLFGSMMLVKGLAAGSTHDMWSLVKKDKIRYYSTQTCLAKAV